jgi:threonine dehydratase
MSDGKAPAATPPTVSDIETAARRIKPFVHRTPVLRCRTIDALAGARVHLKAEHLQRAGAFKMRGASNAVHRLDERTARRGVAAHSSGNHAAALATAAASRGIPCYVVMPADAPETKQAAVLRQGAELQLCEPTLEAREAMLRAVVERTGATEIHPYDHPDVVAGQGTVAVELLEQAPRIGAVIAPVSGGGLLSGIAIASHAFDPSIEVFGAEPENVADAQRSLAAGELRTDGNGSSIADGLLAVLSPFTFDILCRHGVAVTTISDAEIVAAMRLIFDVAKQVVEPSGAAALAGLLALVRQGVPLPADVGVVLSGGNVDLDRLPFRPPDAVDGG